MSVRIGVMITTRIHAIPINWLREIISEPRPAASS
jgi:hypothetical protein